MSQQLAELQPQELTNAIHQLTKVIESAIATQPPKLQVDQEQQGEQSIQSVVNHTQQQAIASPLVQLLTDLTQQLTQGQAQSSDSLKELDTVISDYLTQIQVNVAVLKQKANQQVLKAASNLAEHETIALALALTVSPLIEQLSQHQQQLAQGKAAFKALNNLLDELTTNYAIASTANYIERAIVTQQENIPVALESLTTDLQHERVDSLSALKQLDVVISDYLQQAQDSLAQHEQQIITGVEQAVSKHVEQSAIETLPIIEVLADLTQQLKSNCDRSAETSDRLNEVISGYLRQIEPLLREKQQQITNDAITSISQQINLSAIGSTTAIRACKQIGEDLSMLQTASNTQALKKVHAVVAKHTKETAIALAQKLRDLPLEDIAPRLGLSQDKYDKHKWRCEGQIISINDQKFYDHANLKGGYGAIDLVMHVQAREFKAALGWLADSSLELPPVLRRSPQPQVTERQPFQPPIADESKWLAVRQYLTQKRQLPVALVDELHSQGKVYADTKQNAVFLRQDIDGNLTGASLRGTYNGSSFKGLSTGSRREGGCFSFVQGEGQLQRIVIAESAIDALSAAALIDQPGRTMFVSTDGTGSVPTAWLKQQQQQRVEIVAAHDADRPGEAMAWRLAAELGAVTRATPTVGKDWNEHLLGIASQPDVSGWKLVAQAIGKPNAYTGRIKAVVASGQKVPSEAAAAMRLHFNAYKQTTSDLWQWYEAARDTGKPDTYLERITEVAIAFHHAKSPIPLPEQAAITMHQDLAQHQQLLSVKLWQHYSRDADPAHPIKTASIVAYAAAKDGYSPDKIHRILLHDPTLVKIRERSGDAAAQNHLKIALRFADYQMRSHKQYYQQSRRELGWQL